MESSYNTLDSVQFFTKHRHDVGDLYPSETHFLLKALSNSQTTLDVGCAAGGGFRFSRQVNPNIDYTGVDVSETMIKAARTTYPAGVFLKYDGVQIPFNDRHFDLVFSLGVCHHILQIENFLQEMFRVTKKYLIFDVRLTQKKGIRDPNQSFQKMAFRGSWDQTAKVPYVVLNDKDFYQFLVQRLGAQSLVSIYGYEAPPTALAVTPFKQVWMTSVMIQKNVATPRVEIEHPLFKNHAD